MTFNPLLVLPSEFVVVNVDGGIGVPSFWLMLKTTVGFWPGAEFVTETILTLTPFSCFYLYGTVWASMTAAFHSLLFVGM